MVRHFAVAFTVLRYNAQRGCVMYARAAMQRTLGTEAACGKLHASAGFVAECLVAATSLNVCNELCASLEPGTGESAALHKAGQQTWAMRAAVL